MQISDPIDILILKYLAEGLTAKEIADKQDIPVGIRAVEVRIMKMMFENDCKKQTRLVALAYESGMFSIPQESVDELLNLMLNVDVDRDFINRYKNLSHEKRKIVDFILR